MTGRAKGTRCWLLTGLPLSQSTTQGAGAASQTLPVTSHWKQLGAGKGARWPWPVVLGGTEGERDEVGGEQRPRLQQGPHSSSPGPRLCLDQQHPASGWQAATSLP